LFDVGAEPGGFGYLVLECVEGPTLAELIERGPLPHTQAMRIALQTAEAVEAAHEKGIIHRDLKPANIKLTGDGSVKVLDLWSSGRSHRFRRRDVPRAYPFGACRVTMVRQS
jgi:serine/threonine protein kinase